MGIAGLRRIKAGEANRRVVRLLQRSFAVRFVLLILIFIAVPTIIYDEFRDADAEKITLLEQNTQSEAKLVAAALEPMLHQFNGSNADKLAADVVDLAGAGTVVRVLLRPRAPAAKSGLFLVAAAPPLPATQLDAERERLGKAGVFAGLGQSCAPVTQQSRRYTNVSGGQEVLTSITQVPTEAGCWIVLVSKSAAAVLRSSLGRPYWKSAEVRIAGIIYLLFALVVLWMFFDIWGSLRRFAQLARDIRTGEASGASFERQNRVPEISGIATEFDRLVLGLRASARSIREAAEENAHALKGPLAVIAQSVEPLKRLVAGSDEGKRAVARIERSTERLRLVSASRQLDNVTAEILEAPRVRIDLADLVESTCASFARNYETLKILFRHGGEDEIEVWGSGELFETVVENLLDNAVGFSPAGAMITVSLSREDDMAVLSVADEGPGVAPADLERIFERYYTDRPGSQMAVGAEVTATHFGIGLWVVRRNVEALGGGATARNLPNAGLEVTLRIPLAA